MGKNSPFNRVAKSGRWCARIACFTGIAAVAAGTVLAGCGGDSSSPTAPGAPPGTPNVAGNWTGSYTMGIFTSPPYMWDPCDTTVDWISASFTQDRSRVSGTFSTSRETTLSAAVFEGDIAGGDVRGTITRDSRTRNVAGHAEAGAVTITFTDARCTQSRIELHRQ